jgi:hypothetical protein
MYKLKLILTSAIAICAISLTVARNASAGLTGGIFGTNIISAKGGTVTPQAKLGFLGLAGLIDFNLRGGANSLNVTINYAERGTTGAYYTVDQFTCVLSTPSDVSYDSSTGALTLTVSSADSCTYPESGNSITFQLYKSIGTSRLTATNTNLTDTAGHTLLATTATGELSSIGLPASKILGSSLISVLGGATDNFGDNGSLGLAGTINFNGSGGANSLNITVSYQDDNTEPSPDIFICTLTNPSDVSYTLSNGVGTLTISINPSDSCVYPTAHALNATGSITFKLYSVATLFGPFTRITNAGASFVDSENDVIYTNATGGL